MASQEGPSADEVGPGGENAALRAAGLTGTLLALAAVLVLYLLVAVWPPAPPPQVAFATTTPTTAPGAPGTTPPTTIAVVSAPNDPVQLFGWTVRFEREARLFLVVALAGALGGLVYALRSLAWYTGNRNLKYSWLLTYPLQPVVGAALATITYVVARGGLIVVTTQSSVSFGIEAAGPPIGRDETTVYHALVAAICKVYGFPVGQRVRDHHEVALPVGRKVDISRDHDMGAFRRRVAALSIHPASMVVRRGKRKNGKPWYPGVRRIGMHGKASGPGAFIALIQRRLNAWGHKLKVDGDFAPKTRAAVEAFQKRRGLSPVTGAVGPRTWYALFDKPTR
jgi:hypothetical protein